MSNYYSETDSDGEEKQACGPISPIAELKREFLEWRNETLRGFNPSKIPEDVWQAISKKEKEIEGKIKKLRVTKSSTSLALRKSKQAAKQDEESRVKLAIAQAKRRKKEMKAGLYSSRHFFAPLDSGQDSRQAVALSI